MFCLTKRFCLTILLTVVSAFLFSPVEAAVDFGLDGIAGIDSVVNVVQLTQDETDDWVPCWGVNPWSFDGQWVVFQAEIGVGGTNEIFVMRKDGSDLERLTENDVCDSHGNFTPDGNRIVFQRRVDGDAQVWIMDRDGTNQQSLTEAHGGAVSGGCEQKPMVSPDGSKIAFRTCADDIWVMNIDGSDPVKITGELENCGRHSWSPDSRWVLFNSRVRYAENRVSRIFRARPDGSDLAILSEDVDEDFCENWPAWSPDGENISYRRRYRDPDLNLDIAQIRLMNPDGGNKRVLVSFPAEDGTYDDEWLCAPHSWHSGGRWLVFKKHLGDGSCPYYAVNVETEQIIQLTEDYKEGRMWWSPDGRAILFKPTWANPRRSVNRYNLFVLNLVPWFADEVTGVFRGDDLAPGAVHVLDAPAIGLRAEVTTGAGGASRVLMAGYEENPTGFMFDGQYWDLHVPSGEHVEEIIFRLYFNQVPGHRAYWFDGNAWIACSRQVVVAGQPAAPYDAYAGYVEITISDTTSPNLDQLGGTVFGVGMPPGLDYLSGGGGCFVATAAFGDAGHGMVGVLRDFRDRHLLSSGAGRSFTGFYYRHSPSAASWITGHGAARAAARVLLLPAVAAAWLALNPVFFGLGLLLAAFALFAARLRRRAAAPVAAALLVLCLAAPAAALDINRLAPAPGEEFFVNLRSTRPLGKGELGAGLFGGYSSVPLEGVVGGNREKISKSQVVGVLGLAWGFTPDFQLGLSVPYLFAQNSTLTGADAPDNSGAGDVRIEGKYRFTGGKDSSGFALAPYLSLNTGSEDALMSSDANKGGLILVFDYNWCDHSVVALNLGYEYQSEREYANLRINHGLLFGLGASKVLANGRTAVALEVSGRTDDHWFGSSEATPVMLDGSVTQPVGGDLALTVGAGTGLQKGYGAADYRVFLGLRGAF